MHRRIPARVAPASDAHLQVRPEFEGARICSRRDMRCLQRKFSELRVHRRSLYLRVFADVIFAASTIGLI